MRARIAEILGLDPGRVSVKATTMERMGLVGREEGMGAMATATVVLCPPQGPRPSPSRARRGGGAHDPALGATFGRRAACRAAGPRRRRLRWLGAARGGRGWLLIAATTVLVAGLGLWAAGRLVTGDEDPAEIVIDEVAGMLLALWPLSLGLTLADAPAHLWPWPGWVGGFLLFRLLDILKPPPVSWAERIGGGLGVMLDDLVAGRADGGGDDPCGGSGTWLVLRPKPRRARCWRPARRPG